MKFIFPQNYNFKSKLFGVIDYSTAIFNVIWYVCIYLILNLFIHDWNIKIFLLISLCFPVTLLSIIGFNGEPLIYVFKYFKVLIILKSAIRIIKI